MDEQVYDAVALRRVAKLLVHRVNALFMEHPLAWIPARQLRMQLSPESVNEDALVWISPGTWPTHQGGYLGARFEYHLDAGWQPTELEVFAPHVTLDGERFAAICRITPLNIDLEEVWFLEVCTADPLSRAAINRAIDAPPGLRMWDVK